MKYLLSISVLLICSYFSVFAQNTGSFAMQYDDNGTKRTFAMYVPENYQASKSYTSILAIHGGGMPATFMRDWFKTNADNVSGILTCPDENDTWNGSVAVNALNWTDQTYNLNPEQLVVSGFSKGGELAMRLAWTSPDNVNGLIVVNPFIASIPDELKANISKVPTAIILGKADDNYNNVKQVAQEINNAGGQFLLIEKEGVTHADQNYMISQEFYDDWMTCFTFIFGEQSDQQVDLNMPMDNLSNLLTPAALSWNAMDGADEYTIEISDDEMFEHIAMQKTTSDLYVVTDKLDDNSQYWWRVSALINGEKKYTSDVRTFSSYSDPQNTGHIYLPVELDSFDNEIRHFSVEFPSSFSFSSEYNIILGLHGMGQTETNMSQFLKPYTDYVNAVVVCPSGKGERHDDEFGGMEIEIAKYAVEKVKDMLNTGDNNVYLLGFSYGGREAMYYGLQNHDYFKGIIGLSPAIQSDDDANNNLPIPWANPFMFGNTVEIPICILDGKSDANFINSISTFYDNLMDNGGHMMHYTFADAGHDVTVSSEFDAKLKECFDFINMDGGLPGIFNLLSPENNATDQALDVTLEWIESMGAGQYELVLSKNDDLSNPIQNNILDGNLNQLSDLEESTTYYWKIRALNTYGWTAWSETRSFTTGTKSSVLETENGTMMIYPVPANDYLNLDFSNQTFMDASIEIFNSIGQRVYLNKDVNNLKLQINLIDFKAGQYSIRINLNGEVYNKSFIKL